MRKEILTLSVVCAMLTALTACGNTTTSSSSSSSSMMPETSSSSSMSDTNIQGTAAGLGARYASAINSALPADVTEAIPLFSSDYFTHAQSLNDIAAGTYTNSDANALKELSTGLSDIMSNSYFTSTGDAEYDNARATEKTAITTAKNHLDAMISGSNPQLSEDVSKALKTASQVYGSVRTNLGGMLMGAMQYGQGTPLTQDDVESIVISATGMNTKAHNVILVKPKAGREADVYAAVESYMKNVQKSFENYLPDQNEIAKAALIETLPDGTIALVMTDNAQTVMDSIKASLAKA